MLRDLEAKAANVDWHKNKRKVWYVLFGASGFTDELIAIASERDDVELVYNTAEH